MNYEAEGFFEDSVSASKRKVRRLVGPFELKVLAAINKLGDQAWGSKLRAELTENLGREVAIAQLYSALSRLDDSRFISFEIMDSEPQRGGRSKKRFHLETEGRRALDEAAAV